MSPRAFRSGLCSVTFRALPPARVVELCREAGLDGIEWGGDVHLPPGNLESAHELRELCEAAGLTVPSYGSYLQPPADGALALRPVLATAAALGAATIRIWPGRRDRPSSAYSPAERREAGAVIRDMAQMAADQGVALALEYHPDTLTDDLASAEALLAAVDHRALFTYWQPRPGLPLATALEEVRRLAPWLSHLHVFQWDAHKARYPLADGHDYWATVLDAVRPSRWLRERYAFLEFLPDDDPDRLAAEAASLKALLSL